MQNQDHTNIEKVSIANIPFKIEVKIIDCQEALTDNTNLQCAMAEKI